MLTENLTFISFLSSLFILAIVSIYSYFLYKRESKIEEIEIEAFKKSKDVLYKAHKKAENILDKAVEKSKDILIQTDLFKEYLENDVRKTIQEAINKYNLMLENDSKEITYAYNQLFIKLREKYLEETRITIEKIDETGKNSLMQFTTLFQQEYKKALDLMKKQIMQDFENAKRDIQTYKEGELKQISDRINKLVLRLSEELLGRAITLKDHDRLVLDALEKAKKEGFFELG